MKAQSNNSAYIEKSSIALLWLFHASAIIGTMVGYFDWFIIKTPINLILIGLLLLINFPVYRLKDWIVVGLFFAIAMFVEWLGVKYGYLFGEYTYGENLGPKIDGVPWLIGLNWVILGLSTAAMAQRFVKHSWLKISVGAALMVFLDLFIERVAQPLDFWHWSFGYAPVKNYIAWFVVALILHFIFHVSGIKGKFRFSLHLYLVQFLFFLFMVLYL